MKGYELTDTRYIEEIRATAWVYRHTVSGAKVLYLENPQDDNKVFCIAFSTPPEDDCGTPHILEHTVLCGSDRYPLKDPFMQLGKGSLNTFLNAMTYPDKTLYPVASQNAKDFRTLMDVYMDAVFHPVIRHSRYPFMQEGWHYVPEEDGTVSIKGVVYNEMKGAFSSSEDVLYREIKKQLFPDTAYRYESGGDPQAIPDLTYERYLDFYNRHYAPSNSFIYIYGDGCMEEDLAYLDEQYLSRMPDTGVSYRMEVQAPFAEPLAKRGVYAASDGDDKPYFSYSISYGPVYDPLLYIGVDILEYMLLEAEGAPLKEALRKEHFGEDIFGSNDASLLQPILSIIVKDADPEKESQFVPAIRRIVTQIAEQGFSKDMIEGALNSTEFRLREADYGSAPKGLVYLSPILNSWLYGEDPCCLLEYGHVFDELRRKAPEGFFEDLLRRLILENSHALIYTLDPDPEWNERTEREEKARLAAWYDSLEEEEKEALIQADAELKRFQQKPETEEALSSIPLLELKDIDPHAETFPYTVEEKAGVRTLVYDGFTNGIAYVRMLFDLQALEQEELPYAAMLLELVGTLHTEKYTYEELGAQTNIHTGGIGMILQTYPDTDERCKAYFRVNMKCFYREVPKALDLICEQILKTDFSDLGRIRQILLEMRSRIEMQMQSAGHVAALTQARASYSPSAVFTEITSGPAFLSTLSGILDGPEAGLEEAVEQIRGLIAKIFTRSGLVFGITAEESAVPGIRDQLMDWTEAFPCGEGLKKGGSLALMPGAVGFATSSMVQYVAMAARFSSDYTGHLAVLRSILSQDYLWERVRVLGGAYGCMITITRRKECGIVSYRDPNLRETLDVYRQIPAYLRNFSVGEREMRKYIIGTISDISQPLTVSLKGARALDMYLTGTTDAFMQRIRTEILSTTEEDIRALTGLMEEVYEAAVFCVFGSARKIHENEDLFDEIVELEI